MATNSYTTTAAQRSAPITGSSVFGGLRRTLQRWQEQSRIRAELNMMSHRELADLGLMASDINDVATGRYRRD